MMYPTKVYRGYPWYLDELLTRPYNFKHQHVKQKTERERAHMRRTTFHETESHRISHRHSSWVKSLYFMVKSWLNHS